MHSPWVVTGSTGFALQGVPVEPKDIDIQTDRAGAYEIERLIAAAVVRPVTFSTAERIRSHFGALLLGGVTVEIMGDIEKRRPDGTWAPPPDLSRHSHMVTVEGMRLPVLSLEYEYQAYVALGRTERAAMLRAWLDHDRPGS